MTHSQLEWKPIPSARSPLCPQNHKVTSGVSDPQVAAASPWPASEIRNIPPDSPFVECGFSLCGDLGVLEAVYTQTEPSTQGARPSSSQSPDFPCYEMGIRLSIDLRFGGQGGGFTFSVPWTPLAGFSE